MGTVFGQTFEVCDIHPGGRITLEICGTNVDFNFAEVLIVDLRKIAQSLYDAKNWGSSGHDFRHMVCSPKVVDLYQSLELYADRRGIKMKLVYNEAV